MIPIGGLSETSHAETPRKRLDITDTQFSFVDFEFEMSSRFVKDHSRKKGWDYFSTQKTKKLNKT